MEKTNLKINLIFNTITQIMIYLTPLIVAPYISRVLLPEGVGQYSHAFSYVFYFSTAISLGFSSAGINKIAINRNEKEQYSKYFWAIMLEKFLLGIFFILIYFIFLFITKFDGKVNLNIGFALSIVLLNACIDVKFLFQGLEKFRVVSIVTMVTNILYAISIFLLVKDLNDILIYTILKSSIDLFINLILCFFSIKLIRKPKIDFDICKNIFKISLIFFLPTLLMTIGSQLDQTIVGVLCSDEEVGFYTQASKFPTLISNMTYSIAPVMLSRISYLYKGNLLNEVKSKLSKAFILAFFISIPCCIGLYSIGSIFIPTYFGDKFIPSIPILYILLINTIFSPLSSILINSYFYPTGKTFKLSLFLVCSLIGNILMTIFSIKILNLGGRGAALGTLLAEFILFISLFINTCKILDFKLIVSDLWKILISSFMIFLVIYLINLILNFSPLINVIFDIFIGVLVYCLITLITKEMFVTQILNNIIYKFKSKFNN